MRKVYCDTRKCMSCRACEVACIVRHSQSGNLYGALTEEPTPKRRVAVKSSKVGSFPLRCQHCEDAACIDACKTGATYRDPITGKVLINQDKCLGCWMCVMVCPFGAVFPNHATGKAHKCDLCEGYDTPACVEACPTKALSHETLEEFENNYAQGPLPVVAGQKKQG